MKDALCVLVAIETIYNPAAAASTALLHVQQLWLCCNQLSIYHFPNLTRPDVRLGPCSLLTVQHPQILQTQFPLDICDHKNVYALLNDAGTLDFNCPSGNKLHTAKPKQNKKQRTSRERKKFISVFVCIGAHREQDFSNFNTELLFMM